MHQSQSNDTDRPTISTPGRGLALTIYFLFLGSVLTIVTAPLGVLIAHLLRGRYSSWIDSHLRFQIRTFWLGVIAGIAMLALWNLFGFLNASPVVAWSMGYLFFTVVLVWMVGRCGVGIHRLTSNRPVDAPNSFGFGGAKITFRD